MATPTGYSAPSKPKVYTAKEERELIARIKKTNILDEEDFCFVANYARSRVHRRGTMEALKILPQPIWEEMEEFIFE